MLIVLKDDRPAPCFIFPTNSTLVCGAVKHDANKNVSSSNKIYFINILLFYVIVFICRHKVKAKQRAGFARSVSLSGDPQ